MSIKKYFDEGAGKDTWAVVWRWLACVAGLAAFVGLCFLVKWLVQ